jgi:hypothetical protein
MDGSVCMGGFRVLPALAGFLLLCPLAFAQDSRTSPSESAESVAAALANPLAPITTFVTQARLELGNGPDDEVNKQLRLQPSFFKPLDSTSAILTRTTVPIRFTEFPIDDAGLGDAALTPYYVPDMTSASFFGYGGAFVFPTATEAEFGTEKWSAGPAVIFAQMGSPIVYGGLAQHIWSYAGTDSRSKVSVTTIQPFATYLLGAGWSTTINSETSYSFESPSGSRWVVPVALGISKVINLGGEFLNIGLAVVHYPERPAFSTENEVRLNLTYVLR